MYQLLSLSTLPTHQTNQTNHSPIPPTNLCHHFVNSPRRHRSRRDQFVMCSYVLNSYIVYHPI